MSWARFDDRYDDTRKIKRAWRAHGRAVGLHAMAITYCSRHETDGVVDLDWLIDKLPVARDREKVLHVLVDIGLFEVIDADHYRVHDYLDYNPSREQLEARRRADAARKATGRAAQSERARGRVQPESERTPVGRDAESDGPGPSRPDPEEREGTRTRDAAAIVNDPRLIATVEILRSSPRLHLDMELMGVANVLAMYPAPAPHEKAAHLAVSRAADPAYRTTDGARALEYAFADLAKRERSPGGRGTPLKAARTPKPWDGELAALIEPPEAA